MTIIVSGAAEVGVGKIGYNNLFNEPGVTVTASSEEVGFEKENAYDWVGYDWWKATVNGDSWLRASFVTEKNASYAAIWAHDLADHGASVKVQYSVNGGSSWIDVAIVTPTDNTTIFFSFPQILAADFRIFINSPSTIPVIGQAMIGLALEFPHNMEIGFAPPSIVPEIQMKTAVSENGAFIGGSQINKGITGSFNFTYIDPAWIRANWVPFILHAQTPKPFVFAWDSVNHISETVVAWVTGDSIQKPKYMDSLYMDFGMTFEGNA